MKEISTHKRIRVIKLFLTGLSYDEIARQVGIAKGSVVYIINEFREGYLPVPPDMTEHIDALRQVAVDLRKNNTSIAQVKSCLKLDAKLKEMGMIKEEAEQWLDICQNIASPTASTGQFVKAGLELARLASESGLSYGDLIADYNAKLNRSIELDRQIEQKNEKLNEIKAKHKEEKERATRELDSITKAIATAQDTFRKQKNDLKSQLDEYLIQNKLSLKKVKLVEAVINSGFGDTNPTETEIEGLREQIVATGSLCRLNKQLGHKRSELQSEVDQLAHEKVSYRSSVHNLKHIENKLNNLIREKIQERDRLDVELKSKRAELAELNLEISEKIENLYVSHLIIDFLFAPNSISTYDLDRLVNIMIALRQNRLGIKPNRVIDANGNVICECQVPKVYSNFDTDKVDTDHAREAFAYLLSPLVKDKFVSRHDYEMAEFRHEYSQKTAVMEAILEERSRHII